MTSIGPSDPSGFRSGQTYSPIVRFVNAGKACLTQGSWDKEVSARKNLIVREGGNLQTFGGANVVVVAGVQYGVVVMVEAVLEGEVGAVMLRNVVDGIGDVGAVLVDVVVVIALVEDDGHVRFL
uniref:Uncharacterized protein n=1 Tax=Pristionchus pacificus TaxID=54126 RepID=A0A2A6CNM5_PRIPA|eukprot:PDM79802.1 hypothetical protein PRIPAC_32381 [Pristionchus pacificus]